MEFLSQSKKGNNELLISNDQNLNVDKSRFKAFADAYLFLNSLPKDRVLEVSNLKVLADNKIT